MLLTLVPGCKVSPCLLIPNGEPVAEGPADADVEEDVALVRGHDQQEDDQHWDLPKVWTHLRLRLIVQMSMCTYMVNICIST